jgi:hypothetical protein
MVQCPVPGHRGINDMREPRSRKLNDNPVNVRRQEASVHNQVARQSRDELRVRRVFLVSFAVPRGVVQDRTRKW